MKKFLQSKLFITLASVALLFLAVFLGRQMYRTYLINQEISKLESEIVSFTQENQEIAELIEYLKSQEYKERQARSLLGLQKEGEFAVALPPSDSESNLQNQGGEDSESRQSNFERWWNYFFGE